MGLSLQVMCRRAGREVRFAPIATDFCDAAKYRDVPKPDPNALLPQLARNGEDRSRCFRGLDRGMQVRSIKPLQRPSAAQSLRRSMIVDR